SCPQRPRRGSRRDRPQEPRQTARRPAAVWHLLILANGRTSCLSGIVRRPLAVAFGAICFDATLRLLEGLGRPSGSLHERVLGVTAVPTVSCHLGQREA